MSTFVARLLVDGHNLEEPDRFLAGPQPESEAWLSLEDEASRERYREQREGYVALKRLPAERPDVYKQIGNMADDQLRKLAIASGYDTEIDRFVWLTAAIPALRTPGDPWPNAGTTLLVSISKLDVWPGLLKAQGGTHWRLDPTYYITNPTLAIREPAEAEPSEGEDPSAEDLASTFMAGLDGDQLAHLRNWLAGMAGVSKPNFLVLEGVDLEADVLEAVRARVKPASTPHQVGSNPKPPAPRYFSGRDVTAREGVVVNDEAAMGTAEAS